MKCDVLKFYLRCLSLRVRFESVFENLRVKSGVSLNAEMTWYVQLLINAKPPERAKFLLLSRTGVFVGKFIHMTRVQI